MHLSAKIIKNKNHKKYFPINGVLLRKIERMDENKKNYPLNENSS